MQGPNSAREQEESTWEASKRPTRAARPTTTTTEQDAYALIRDVIEEAMMARSWNTSADGPGMLGPGANHPRGPPGPPQVHYQEQVSQNNHKIDQPLTPPPPMEEANIQGICETVVSEMIGEAVNRMHEEERRIEDGPNGGKVEVGSVDVKALYPSLLKKESAALIRGLIEETEMHLEGVDYGEVARGVSMLATQDQIDSWGLNGYCPVRVKTTGPRPGMCTVSKAKLKLKWRRARMDPKTRKEKLRLVAKFVELLVIEVFSNHIYEFGGEIYRQKDGGPIGLSLSGAVGRAVMAKWDREVGAICAANGVRMMFRARYVDDCNALMESWIRGWR
jgi:hypothetical protein